MSELERLLHIAFDARYLVKLTKAFDGDCYCALWKDGEDEIHRKEEHAVRNWLAQYKLGLDTLEKNGWHLICSIKPNGDRHYSLARKMAGINLIIHTDVRYKMGEAA